MYDALAIAATGMQAQQLNVETLANNIANVNTTAFKKLRASFADAVTADTARTASAAGGSAPSAAPQRLGAGVVIAQLERLFDTGEIRQTGRPLDIAINGAGLLEIALTDGATGYSRGGSLKVGADGLLATASGHALKPAIAVPASAQSITITPTGEVKAMLPGKTQPVELGRLELVRFANPSRLQSTGDGVYRATTESGEATLARHGQDDSGSLVQGAVEGSNVKLVDEMMALILAQRAYEANVQVAKAADELSAMANNLRGK